MSTKLTRQTLTQFGSLVNGASEVGVFGSGAAGSPVYTATITLIQSLAAWGRGWAAETIANNRPFLEDMNAVDCVFGYQLCYLFQEGIPEYDTSGNTFYFLYSIVQSAGVVYQVINDNGGAGISATAPGNAVYWKVLIPNSAIQSYGSATNSFASLTFGNIKVCYGSVTVASETIVIINLPFSSSTSYVVVASGQSSGTAVSVNSTNQSGAQTTLYTSQSGQVINWLAIGT